MVAESGDFSRFVVLEGNWTAESTAAWVWRFSGSRAEGVLNEKQYARWRGNCSTARDSPFHVRSRHS